MFDYEIKELERQEIPVLKEMLYHAVFMPDGSEPLPKEIIKNPKISVYIDGWGKPDDYCLVAKSGGKIIGAVWIRVWGGKIKGYGYIDDKTPEFAISVLPEFRKLGIGTVLMQSMIAYMKRKGYQQTSLSVDKQNYAVKMYKDLGFEVIKKTRHDFLMLLKLNEKAQKSLHEMTPKELGKLFPIEIVDYNKNWAKLYKKESRKIIKAVGKNNIENIHHIGSTSIKGLKAKPTIDILLEISNCADLKIMERAIVDIGYEATIQKDNPPPHLTFYKGHTVNGFLGEVYHLHIRYRGVQDELIFRDYLRKNQQDLKEYEKLKLSLVDEFKNDRDGYTNAKTEFVNRVLKEAKVEKA